MLHVTVCGKATRDHRVTVVPKPEMRFRECNSGFMLLNIYFLFASLPSPVARQHRFDVTRGMVAAGDIPSSCSRSQTQSIRLNNFLFNLNEQGTFASEVQHGASGGCLCAAAGSDVPNSARLELKYVYSG